MSLRVDGLHVRHHRGRGGGSKNVLPLLPWDRARGASVEIEQIIREEIINDCVEISENGIWGATSPFGQAWTSRCGGLCRRNTP